MGACTQPWCSQEHKPERKGTMHQVKELFAVWRSERRRAWVCPVCVTGLVGTERQLISHFEACLVLAADKQRENEQAAKLRRFDTEYGLVSALRCEPCADKGYRYTEDHICI